MQLLGRKSRRIRCARLWSTVSNQKIFSVFQSASGFDQWPLYAMHASTRLTYFYFWPIKYSKRESARTKRDHHEVIMLINRTQRPTHSPMSCETLTIVLTCRILNWIPHMVHRRVMALGERTNEFIRFLLFQSLFSFVRQFRHFTFDLILISFRFVSFPITFLHTILFVSHRKF